MSGTGSVKPRSHRNATQRNATQDDARRHATPDPLRTQLQRRARSGAARGSARRLVLRCVALRCGRCGADAALHRAHARRLSGSRDETVRVWSVSDGRPVTLFDVHAGVCDVLMTSDAGCDVIMTSDAGRIVVRLADSCHVPILCLHNSPASSTAASGHRHNHLEPPIIGGVDGQSLYADRSHFA